MNENEKRQWLTVDEAYIECANQNLSRTKKTIRQWCRQEHVESQKRITPNGEQWMIDASSLSTKIKSELDFIKPLSQNSQHPNMSEPVRTQSEPVHTRTHQYEQVQTRTNQQEPTQTLSNQDETRELKNQIRSLEIDKGIRDKQIEFLKDENEKGRDTLSAQSRYIGHLETLALQSGTSPDAKFLSSPVPKPESDTNTPVEKINGSEVQNSNFKTY